MMFFLISCKSTELDALQARTSALEADLAACKAVIPVEISNAQRMAHVHNVRRMSIRGKNLYDRACSDCHEFNGAGNGLTPPIYDAMATKLDTPLLEVINNGTEAAPGHRFGYEGPSSQRLTNQEQREILSYMREAFGPL